MAMTTAESFDRPAEVASKVLRRAQVSKVLYSYHKVNVMITDTAACQSSQERCRTDSH
jgi:hypothetical protein